MTESRISKSTLVWGHRGFEKQVESGSWDDALPYVSRLGWASGLHAEIAYCLAAESLAEIASPRSRDLDTDARRRTRARQ